MSQGCFFCNYFIAVFEMKVLLSFSWLKTVVQKLHFSLSNALIQSVTIEIPICELGAQRGGS